MQMTWRIRRPPVLTEHYRESIPPGMCPVVMPHIPECLFRWESPSKVSRTETGAGMPWCLKVLGLKAYFKVGGFKAKLHVLFFGKG